MSVGAEGEADETTAIVPDGASGATGPARRRRSAFWWLVRSRWTIFWNTIARGARWRRLTYGIVAGGLVVICLALGVLGWGLTSGLKLATTLDLSAADIAAGVDPRSATDVILATAFSGAMLLAVMVGFTVSLAALYLARDLDMLLVSPVSRRAVFASKLLGGILPGFLLVGVITVLPLIGHGMANEYGASYWAALVVALVLTPVLPTAFGAVAVVFIVRRVPAHRLGEIVGLIVVAMTLAIVLLLGSANRLQETMTFQQVMAYLNRARSPYSPAEWLTRFLAASGRHDTATALRWLAINVGVAAAALVPLYAVSDRMYQEGWLRMHSANLRRVVRRGILWWQRPERAADLGRPSGLLARLPAPVVAMIRKDARLIPRDLTNAAQVLSPLAFGVFFVIQQLLYPLRIGGGESGTVYTQPVLTMFAAFVATGVASMVFSRVALTGISVEGKRWWLLRSAPLSAFQLVLAKFLVAFLPYGVLSGALILLFEGARLVRTAVDADMGLVAGLALVHVPSILYAWFASLVVGAGVVAVSLAVGAARPNLKWDSPHEMMTPDVGCLSILFYGAYAGVTSIALLLPGAVGGFPMLAHPWAFWLAGLTIGLGTTAVVVGGSLWLAAGEVPFIDG
ncbi:MAG: hypothetical protein ABI780_03500 [Ardenticatenales bacterium]